MPQHLQFQTRMKIAEIFNEIAYSMSSANPCPCSSASTYSTPTPVPPENMPPSAQYIPAAATCQTDMRSSGEFNISDILFIKKYVFFVVHNL